MEDKTVNEERDTNEISIDELPVTVRAYEDENGYAIVISSEDARIGDAKGRLVKNHLVRIVRGDVPRASDIHEVRIANQKTRNIEVGKAHIDERGKMFVTDATTGSSYPSATQG